MRMLLSGATALLLACPAVAENRSTDTLLGVAIALDGDTLRLSVKDAPNVKVRLFGVDAPEMHVWPGGAHARAALDTLLARTEGKVLCTKTGKSGDRIVAQCWLGWQGGALTADRELSALMIESGYAIEYRSFSGGLYSPLERAAQEARRGVWHGWTRP